jgi:hypothetical protein
MSLRNVCKFLLYYTASHPEREKKSHGNCCNALISQQLYYKTIFKQNGFIISLLEHLFLPLYYVISIQLSSKNTYSFLIC